MPDAPAKQIHFAQHRTEHRQRGDTGADAHRRGELDRADTGRQLLWVARQDPVSYNTAKSGRDRHAGRRHDRRRATIAAECLGIEMQSGDQAKNQNRNRPDSGQGRQCRLIEKQLVVFRGEPSKQRWPEGDADDDLNDDQRHHPLQARETQQRHR